MCILLHNNETRASHAFMSTIFIYSIAIVSIGIMQSCVAIPSKCASSSTAWDDPFETDQAALDEAMRAIREKGVSTFQDGENVIRFPR